MREYRLVPSDQITKSNIVTTTLDADYADKINIAKEKYRKDVAAVNESLTPEMQLKLINYFQKHLDNKMKIENKVLSETNEAATGKNEVEKSKYVTDIVNRFLSPLPGNVTKIGNTLGHYLMSFKNLTIDDKGFISKDGFAGKVHILDMVKTIVTNNYKVTNNVRSFLKNIEIPDAFRKNRNLKIKANLNQFGGLYLRNSNAKKYLKIKWDELK